MNKFQQQLSKLSDRQISLARYLQASGITTYSQAIKSLAAQDGRVDEWLKQIDNTRKQVTEDSLPFDDGLA